MADVKVTVAPAGARLKAVSIPGPVGPAGPQGPKGDDGASGTGSVPATPDTLVQRDGAGSIKAAGIEAASLTSVASPPNTGLPSAPVLADAGTLDPTKTYYYLIQYFWQGGSQYNFAEQTVAMNGHTSVEFSIQAAPSPPNSPIQLITLQRTEEPGNYNAPYGLVAYILFSGGETYPLSLKYSGGDPPMQYAVGASNTIPWSIAQLGFSHTGQITGAKVVATDAVPDDSNDSTLVPSSWVMAKISALQAQIDALTPH